MIPPTPPRKRITLQGANRVNPRPQHRKSLAAHRSSASCGASGGGRSLPPVLTHPPPPSRRQPWLPRSRASPLQHAVAATRQEQRPAVALVLPIWNPAVLSSAPWPTGSCFLPCAMADGFLFPSLLFLLPLHLIAKQISVYAHTVYINGVNPLRLRCRYRSANKHLPRVYRLRARADMTE